MTRKLGKQPLLRVAYPDLYAELVAENDEATVREITAGSSQRLMWRCQECGYSWPAAVAARRNGAGCPPCRARARRRPRGKSLLEAKPDLAHEWDTARNGVGPDEIAPQSAQRAWWLCGRGHTWQAIVSNRFKGAGCKECLDEDRSLAAIRPDLLLDWPDGRNAVRADRIRARSATVVWWQCSTCAHEWQESVKARVRGARCQECYPPRPTVRQARPDLVPEWSPSNTATPDQLTAGSGRRVEWICLFCGKAWKAIVANRVKTATPGCADCSRQRGPRTPQPFLADERPDLAVEWDLKQNSARPETTRIGSNIVVNWICSTCGNSWPASLDNRVRNGAGCPAHGCRYARGLKVASVVALAEAWDEANELSPGEVSVGSNVEATWRGVVCGHRWTQSVANVTRSGLRCPECSPHLSLRDARPDLAAEVVDEGGVDPALLGWSSGRIVRWRCARCQRVWPAAVYNRSRLGAGCPRCSERGRRRSVVADHPELMTLWSPNNQDDPTDVAAHADRELLWVCAVGHEWAAFPARQANQGCPICSNHRTLSGFNDLATTHPDIARQWAPNGNDRTPQEVTAGSGYRPLWECEKGHRWRTQVALRARGSRCPDCTDWGRSGEEHRLAEALGEAGYSVVDDREGRVLPVAWGHGRRRHAECDIVLPSHRAVVEYDGVFWHTNRFGTDQAKTKALLLAGWAVIRIRENGLDFLPLVHSRLLQLDHTWGDTFGAVLVGIGDFLDARSAAASPDPSA